MLTIDKLNDFVKEAFGVEVYTVKLISKTSFDATFALVRESHVSDNSETELLFTIFDSKDKSYVLKVIPYDDMFFSKTYRLAAFSKFLTLIENCQ